MQDTNLRAMYETIMGNKIALRDLQHEIAAGERELVKKLVEEKIYYALSINYSRLRQVLK